MSDIDQSTERSGCFGPAFILGLISVGLLILIALGQVIK